MSQKRGKTADCFYLAQIQISSSSTNPVEGIQQTTMVVGGLENGREYKMRCRAINTSGLGAIVELKELAIPHDVLIAPEIIVDPEVGQYVTVKSGQKIVLKAYKYFY